MLLINGTNGSGRIVVVIDVTGDAVTDVDGVELAVFPVFEDGGPFGS